PGRWPPPRRLAPAPRSRRSACPPPPRPSAGTLGDRTPAGWRTTSRTAGGGPGRSRRRAAAGPCPDQPSAARRSHPRPTYRSTATELRGCGGPGVVRSERQNRGVAVPSSSLGSGLDHYLGKRRPARERGDDSIALPGPDPKSSAYSNPRAWCSSRATRPRSRPDDLLASGLDPAGGVAGVDHQPAVGDDPVVVVG